MNIKFFTIGLIAFTLQVQAKSFRANDDFLKSFVKKIKFLKSASVEDIHGATTNVAPTHEGDIPHAATHLTDVASTARIIEQQLAIGLRSNFIFIKQALTQYADEDGIVREGVVFCNARDTDGSGRPYTSKSAEDIQYAPGTSNLVPGDGLGVRDATLTLVNGKNRTAEYTQCQRSDCEEGSFVTLLTNRIRSLGYHITHADVCEAENSAGGKYSAVPTCALKADTNTFKSYKCAKETDVLGTDFYHKKEACFMSEDCSEADCAKFEDNGDNLCLVNTSYLGASCVVNELDELEYVELNGARVINGVRRQIQYGVPSSAVETTDAVYVTGSPADQGCKSLRDFVVALNGAAQIAAFRDTNILEAEAHWNDVISHARSYIKSYAGIINDFYDKSTQIFPLIEFEDVESCPVGTTEKLEGDLGTSEAPLCDSDSFKSLNNQKTMDLESQTLARGRCFCRQGAGLSNSAQIGAANTNSSYERDDIYLTTRALTDTDCDALKTLEFPSYYQYCMGQSYDDRTWKKTLEDLLPMKHAIKTFGMASKKTTKRETIYENIAKTFPSDTYDTTTKRMTISDEQNCGRLLSTSTSGLHSNKGGNCVPFRGMHEILFRLEFETSQDLQGEQNDCANKVFANEKDCKFEDVTCRQQDALETTLYSFRQIGYEWDHPMYKSGSASMMTEPKLVDKLSTWVDGFDDADTVGTATKGLQNQNSWSPGRDKLFRRTGATTIGGVSMDDKQACNINWGLQLTGDVARKDAKGSVYKNPYDLFTREIAESVLNTEIAIAAKVKSVSDYEKLWAEIQKQLTTFNAGTGGNSISEDISTEVAEHFMRITTTDSDDNAVDSTDAGAERSNGEGPTEMNATGSSQ
tara:strand:+ start:4210 stop:6801 length:2592 start_codon:yes stop_codon:yes gene_type:complete